MSNEVVCIAIGDLHFKVSNSIEDINTLIANTILWVEKIKPHFIVLLGDILDGFEKVQLEMQCLAMDFILKLTEYSDVIYTVGNHNIKNNSQFLTPVHDMRGLKNAKTKNRLLIVDDEPQSFYQNGLRFLALPYCPPGRFQEALDYFNTKHYKDWTKEQINKKFMETTAIFCHQEFKGCILSADIKSESGDVWSKDFPQIISGHIHKNHKPQENVYFIGTPYNTDYSIENINEKKGIFAIKFKRENNISSYKDYRLELNIPRKLVIQLTYEELEKYDFTPYKNDKYKVVIKDSLINIKANNKRIEEICKKNNVAKIAYKTITEYKKMSFDGSFLDSLSNYIKDNNELTSLYKKIFFDISQF